MSDPIQSRFIKPLRQNMVLAIVKFIIIIGILSIVIAIASGVAIGTTIATEGIAFGLLAIVFLGAQAALIFWMVGNTIGIFTFSGYYAYTSDKDRAILNQEGVLYMGLKAFLISWEYPLRIILGI